MRSVCTHSLSRYASAYARLCQGGDSDSSSQIIIVVVAVCAAVLLVFLIAVVFCLRSIKQQARRQNQATVDMVSDLQERTAQAVIATHRRATSFTRRLSSPQTTGGAPTSTRQASAAQRGVLSGRGGGSAADAGRAWLESSMAATEQEDLVDICLDQDEEAISSILSPRSSASGGSPRTTPAAVAALGRGGSSGMLSAVRGGTPKPRRSEAI